MSGLTLKQKLRVWSDQEARRFLLWVPVLFLVGISIYFGLPREPNGWAFFALTGVAGLSWWLSARVELPVFPFVLKIVAIILCGGMMATIRTQMVATPVLERVTPAVTVTGQVVAREDRTGDQRFVIKPHYIEVLPEDQLPERIRVTWRGKASTALPGDVVRFRGVLNPPPAPAYPGGYDYAQQLYFGRIGAVGFTYQAPSLIHRPEKQPIAAWIERTRGRIADHVRTRIGGAEGAVAAALVTGKREAIPEEVTQQLRDTGLAHLLAISGLHMGLVCGFLFFGVRFILVRIGDWAARYPLKKWSAMAALMGGIIYLTISGGAWSAQRAFIMAAIGFFAILVDRRAISLRNVAIAAIIILIWRPEAALAAGFQMSFAAVMALIAAYELWDRHRAVEPTHFWLVPVRFVVALSFTSLVAGLATGPFAIYHFNRIAVYGLIGNLLVMPIFTILVMPLSVIGLALMPLGLDAPVWWIVGQGLSLIVFLTEWVASWTGALVPVPQWSLGAWLTVIAGLIVLCLLRANWRWGGAILMMVGYGWGALSPRPDLYISEEVDNVGVLTGSKDAPMVLQNRRRDRFAVDRWLESEGISIPRRDLPTMQCDEAICTVTTRSEKIIAYTEDRDSVIPACQEADLVISPLWEDVKEQQSCDVPLFTANSVSRTGPVSVRWSGDRWQIDTVQKKRGQRPWVTSAN